MDLLPILPKVLSVQVIEDAHPELAAALGAPASRRTLGLVTCDQDDSLYAALDEGTKAADVEVVYARSLYAGAAHSSGPLSGEVLGVIAGADPDEVREGLKGVLRALRDDCRFYGCGPGHAVALFPHVIPRLGTYLSAQSGLRPGDSMAYLIAPPVESQVGLDAALKAADVRLVKHFGPPTETNFGGGWLTGPQAACEAAARAFAQAVATVAARPVRGI